MKKQVCFPERKPIRHLNGKHPTRHPWDRWLGQRSFTLKRGIHFQCMVHCMGVMLRTQARKRNLGISVSISGNNLHVTTWKGI